MSMLSLRPPESLHPKMRELATKESISINQFITTAVAEKMAALLTEEYLEERARGRRTQRRSTAFGPGCWMFLQCQATSQSHRLFLEQQIVPYLLCG